MSEALNPELVMQLRVTSARMVADDIREFEFVDPDGAELPEFTPGAHLLIQMPAGMTRRYSIINPPSERVHYMIAVKRETGGRGGSISAVDDIAVGDVVHVSLPRNEFALVETAPSYLFIAGGIGITPIRSMIRHLQETTSKPFRLLYLSRRPEVTAYRDEFAGVDYRGKAVIHHDFVLSDPERLREIIACVSRARSRELAVSL